MVSIDQCIEFLAANGASKNSVAKALGYSYTQFLDLCKVMPDVKWKPKGQTNGDLYAKKKQRGRCSALKLESLIKATDASVQSRRVKVAFGTIGTIAELTDKFGVVSLRRVMKRLAEGMSLEDALTTPGRYGRTAFGKTGTIAELVDEFATVKLSTVEQRLASGMDLETALTMPSQRGKHECCESR